jgi:hypothetical protein
MSDPCVYRERLFTLLGDREPIAAMRQTASTLAEIVRSHSATVLRTRPFPGKWTPNEIIGHLVDGEWVYGSRMRLVLSEDDPPIIGTNQDAWVARQRHNDRDPAELVEEFRTMRAFNLALSQRLSPEELTRTGRHNQRGSESLAVMMRMVAAHDLSHLDQINRYIQAVR